MRSWQAALGGAAFGLLASVAAAAEPAPAAAVADAAPSATWDLRDLYPDDAAWTASYERVRAAAMNLDRLKASLGTSATSMARALATISDVRRETARLRVYADLKGDEDLRVATAQERRQQAQSLSSLIDARTAWLAPEVIRIGRTRVEAFLAQNRDLRVHFDVSLRDMLRAAPHTLGPEAEAVLAGAGDVLSQPTNVYGVLSAAELPFPTIALSSGESVRIDESAYEKQRASASRADRKAVFDAFWGTWKSYQGTMGANLASQVIGEVFSARARHFDHALDAALFADNMPPVVYRTLVEQVNAALPTLHRYLRLRKRLLGIHDDLAYYDGYPSLFPDAGSPDFTVAESERLTLAALEPMGEEYLGLLRRGFASRWMDALPRRGKATGGYMNGDAYGVHPYLLLNHNDDYESLSTVAHEWGHAVHTMLSEAHQPFEKASYSTFIAESASIGNEMLLNDYMVANAKSNKERLFYLGEALESIRTTFFRQVMFAEFQLQMHEEIEQGRPLSGDRLTQMYCALLQRYSGADQGVMKIDPLYCTEWESVPHFYYGFYVYQYATSMAGAAQFTDAILKEGRPARDRFIAMLEAGGSAYPYDLYKNAGIDMATPAPYQALVARMNRLLDEVEALVAAGP
jgi:oligoendopeptidase F